MDGGDDEDTSRYVVNTGQGDDDSSFFYDESQALWPLTDPSGSSNNPFALQHPLAPQPQIQSFGPSLDPSQHLLQQVDYSSNVPSPSYLPSYSTSYNALAPLPLLPPASHPPELPPPLPPPPSSPFFFSSQTSTADQNQQQHVPAAANDQRREEEEEEKTSLRLRDFFSKGPGALTPFSEQWCELLLANSPDLVFALAFRGNILYVSPAACARILQYEEQELAMRSFYSICHPVDVPMAQREIRDAATAAATIEMLVRVRRKWDGYVWLEMRGSIAEMSNNAGGTSGISINTGGSSSSSSGSGVKYLLLSGREYALPTLSRRRAAASSSSSAIPSGSIDNIGASSRKRSLAPAPMPAPMSLSSKARTPTPTAQEEPSLWLKLTPNGLILFASSNALHHLGREPHSLVGLTVLELIPPEFHTQFMQTLYSTAAPVTGGTRPPSATCRHQIAATTIGGRPRGVETTFFSSASTPSSQTTRSAFVLSRTEFYRKLKVSRAISPPSVAATTMGAAGSSAASESTVTAASPVPKMGQMGLAGERVAATAAMAATATATAAAAATVMETAPSAVLASAATAAAATATATAFSAADSYHSSAVNPKPANPGAASAATAATGSFLGPQATNTALIQMPDDEDDDDEDMEDYTSNWNQDFAFPLHSRRIQEQGPTSNNPPLLHSAFPTAAPENSRHQQHQDQTSDAEDDDNILSPDLGPDSPVLWKMALHTVRKDNERLTSELRSLVAERRRRQRAAAVSGGGGGSSRKNSTDTAIGAKTASSSTATAGTGTEPSPATSSTPATTVSGLSGGGDMATATAAAATAAMMMMCANCRTRTTPEWRKGPSGKKDLCNRCGLRWAKSVRDASGFVSQKRPPPKGSGGGGDARAGRGKA